MPNEDYKGRHMDVYFPSEKFLERWKARAKAAKLPLSSWVFETVEHAIDDSASTSVREVAKENTSMRDEARKLRQENEHLQKLMESYKTEAFNLRNRIFLQREMSGSGEFDSQLCSILRTGGVWTTQDLLRELGVDARDVDALQVVGRQLQVLQDIGVVQSSVKGWRWLS